jgi:C1A family cysteine protease
MRSFIAAALVAAVSASSEVEAAFLGYIVQFGKSYDNVEEYGFRFSQFAKKHAQILEHNAGEETYKLGHNKMSDWTEEEFEALLTYKAEARTGASVSVNATAVPINWVDLGAVSPVQDQGQCGSCWAFSSVSAFESAHFIHAGVLEKYSEQQLVDCVNLCAGCNGGLQSYAFRYYESHFAMYEASYPYTAMDGTCSYSSSDNSGIKAKGWANVTASNVTDMKAALSIAPLSVAIQANQFCFQMYSSGVFTNTKCGTSLDHATNVVGWATDATDGDYWIMRNSWGASWGEAGYMYVKIVDGDGLCGIQMEPQYPTSY